MPEELYTANDRMQMGLCPTGQLNQTVLCACTSLELIFKEAKHSGEEGEEEPRFAKIWTFSLLDNYWVII